MALKPPDSKSDKFAISSNNNRPFSEPPPYPGTTPRSTYSHVSHSTLTKFTGTRADPKPIGAPNSVQLDHQRKPYVPLGEIRRNIPPQSRVQGGQPQQVLLPPNSGQPSSYNSLHNFPQGSQGPSRTPVFKDEADDDLSFQMSEDELLMLSIPVLARKLVEAQNRIATQSLEVKGCIIFITTPLFPLYVNFSRLKILFPAPSRRQSRTARLVLFPGR